MMPATSLPFDLRGPARPWLPAATATTAFAGILDMSGNSANAAAGDGAASLLQPLQLTPQAIGPSALPTTAAEAILAAGNIAAAPKPQVDAAPIADTSAAAPSGSAPTATPKPLAARAQWSDKPVSATALGNADPSSVAPTQSKPEAQAADQTVPVPATAADHGTHPAQGLPPLNEVRTADLPAIGLAIAHAAKPAPPTATTAAPSDIAAQRLGAPQIAKNSGLLGLKSAAPSAMPVVAPVDRLPSALPVTSLPVGTDALSAAQVGGVTDFPSLAGAVLTTSAPTASAFPAAAAGDPPLRQLDLGNDNHWIASLAQDIAALQADDGLLRFQLMPRHLGRIEVSMQTSSEGVSVRVAAENAAAQSILAAAQTRLVDDLRTNGVRIAGADIGMQAESWTHDRRDQARSHSDQRWNFVESGHAADPVPQRTRRSGADRLA